MPIDAVFAVPGSLDTQTGGTFFDRRLVESLRGLGHGVDVIALPQGFPFADAAAEAAAIAQLCAVGAGRVLVVDGLAYGALPTAGLAQVAAPLVALVHHPLAMETGLSPDAAAHLLARERDNLALARHVLVPSPHTKRLLVDRYGVDAGKVTVLLPGIDRPAPVAAMRDDPPLILSVGLLHPRKGHDVLLAALARITDLDWRAVIAGTPWDAAHVALLTRQAADPALSGRVRLAGAVSDAERDALYARASLFALATRYEGYGIVFNEALVHSLPILSCRTGAVPDTVPPDAGLLVDVDDAGALADALRSILTDHDRRAAMARTAAVAGAALPSWTDTAKRAVDALKGAT